MIKTCLVIAMAVLAPRAHARVTPLGWTVGAEPSIFTTFPYPYRVAGELEVSKRKLILMVDDFDPSWMNRADELLALDPDLTLDYLNEQSVADLRLKDAALAETLTQVAVSKPKVREQLLINLEQHRADRFAELRAKTANEGLIRVNPLADVPALLSPSVAFKLRTPGIQSALQLPSREEPPVEELKSDWTIFNKRWNALPAAVRLKLISPALLAADKKAELIHQSLRAPDPKQSTWSRRFRKTITDAGAAAYLHPFMVRRDKDANEFKHRVPVTSVRTYLDQIYAFARGAGATSALRRPLDVSRRDTGYHLNLSVTKRPGSLKPILRAWQTLIVIKHLEAGIQNLFNKTATNYNIDLNEKGMVKLKGLNFIEIRDHFTDPETEAAMLMEAIARPNADAIKLISQSYMPPVTAPMLRFIATNDRTAFLSIAFGTPGLNVEVPADLATDPLQDAYKLAYLMVHNPHVHEHLPRLRQFLGVEGMKELRAQILKVLSSVDIIEPDALAGFRKFIVANRTQGGPKFWMSKDGRTVTKILMLEGMWRFSNVFDRGMDVLINGATTCENALRGLPR